MGAWVQWMEEPLTPVPHRPQPRTLGCGGVLPPLHLWLEMHAAEVTSGPVRIHPVSEAGSPVSVTHRQSLDE